MSVGADGGNDYFDLNPGHKTYFNNSECVAEGDCDEREDLTITVTRELKKVVIDVDRKPKADWTRVILENEKADGELLGDLAQLLRDVHALAPTSIISARTWTSTRTAKSSLHDGAWLAGPFRRSNRDHHAGLRLPARPALLPRTRARSRARSRGARGH